MIEIRERFLIIFMYSFKAKYDTIKTSIQCLIKNRKCEKNTDLKSILEIKI